METATVTWDRTWSRGDMMPRTAGYDEGEKNQVLKTLGRPKPLPRFEPALPEVADPGEAAWAELDRVPLWDGEPDLEEADFSPGG